MFLYFALITAMFGNMPFVIFFLILKLLFGNNYEDRFRKAEREIAKLKAENGNI